MFDSVFEQFFQIPYPDDKPVTPEREILRELEEIEKQGAIAIHKVMSQLAPSLTSEEALKEGRKKAIALLQKAFYSVWLAGWGSGGSRADEEIKRLSQKSGKFTAANNIAQFRRKDDTKRTSIRNVAAERAIRQRTNKLAADVTDSEFKRIQQHILAAVTPQPDTGNPISREELLKRINAELGASSQRFANRAERIARTELTFAYNAGRLDTYRQSGVVTAVSYFCITDERVCLSCLSRNGLLIPLDDAKAIAANSPPLHPLCRCLLSPVLDGDPRLKDKNRRPDRRQLAAAPPAWMAAAILAAVLLGSVTLAGSKVKQVTDAVETIGTVASGLVAAEALGEIAKATGEQPSSDEQPVVEPEPEPLPPSPMAAQVAVSDVARIPSVMIGAVNLNTATFDELRSLLPKRLFTDAQINSILKERDANGYFESIEDLRNRVRGIGKRTQERLQGLSEGSDIFVFLDPDNVRTPAQLWASNLGLTRAQAQMIFEEMQRAPFKDFEDLRRRLKGRGIGEKTIENMQQRATIRQRIAQQLRQQVRQGVGEASPDRTPSPYGGTGVGRVDVTSAPTPPPSLPPRPPTPTIDPLLSAKVDSIETAVLGFNDSVPRAFDTQANKRTILGKNFNQIASEHEAVLNGLQKKYDAIASSIKKTGNQLDDFERRLSEIEGDRDRLLDPAAPNYFEKNYRELISVRDGLTRNKRNLPSPPGDSDLKALNTATAKLENALSKVSDSSSIKKLRESQEGLRDNIADAVRELQNQEAEFLKTKTVPPPELQRLKEKYSSLQNQLQDVDDYLNSQFASKVDAAKRLDPVKNDLQDAIASTYNRIEQLRDRVSSLPLTKQDLDPATRTKYEALVDLRRTQKSFREGAQKFRQTRSAVERNLNNRDAAQQKFYEGYDQFRTNFEQSNSPLIERQVNQLTSDLQALEAMPKGQVAWLLSFNGYDFSGIPNDLALATQGLPEETAATRLQALGRDIGNRLGRVKSAIASVENNAQFKYPITQGGKRTIYDQTSALSRAETELKYWEDLRNKNLDVNNTGSSKNRLASLDPLDATPDDTLGHARGVLTDLDQWNQKYSTLKNQGVGVGLEPVDQLQERFGQAQDNFLNELGETRIAQSQIIERAYQDAKDIYERIRSDSSKVPVFDINGQAVPQNQLLEQLKEYSQRVEALRQLREIPTLPAPADASQLPIIQTLNTQRQAIASQLDDAVKERDAIATELNTLQEQGRGTKRKQQELDRARAKVNDLSQQEAGLATEMSDRSLPTNQYNQLQELQSQLTDARANLASLQSQLSEVNREVSNLTENVQRVSGQTRERMQRRLDAATSRRERLSGSVSAAAGRINAINGQIGEIRGGS